MSVAVIHVAPVAGLQAQRAARASSPALLRLLLIAGGLAAVAAVAWLGQPAAQLRADPELAHLLRGMAALKAAIVLAAFGVLHWRFGRPIAQRTALAYLGAAWLMAGASMLVWQLTLIPVAAVAFHVGEFTLLLAAWRDVKR